MTELHDLSARGQAAAVRAGEVGAVELIEHYLQRIASLDFKVGAFVTVTEESAYREAADAQRRLRTGEPTSPLHGVPTAVKDLNPMPRRLS